jgi:hypothetical protein
MERNWFIILLTSQDSESLSHSHSIPHSLTCFHGIPLIDHWYRKIVREGISPENIFLLTNQRFFSIFTEWGQSRSIPYINIIHEKQIGIKRKISQYDFDFFWSVMKYQTKFQQQNLLVIDSTCAVNDDFDLSHFFIDRSEGLLTSITLDGLENDMFVAEDRTVSFPEVGTNSHFVPIFSLPLSISSAFLSFPDEIRTFPGLIKYISGNDLLTYHSINLSHYYPLDSSHSYNCAMNYFDSLYQAQYSHLPSVVNLVCPARAGLLGNPSDGFHGKTLSFVVPNFFAQVTISANETDSLAVEIIPHPQFDMTHYASFDTLHKETQLNVFPQLIFSDHFSGILWWTSPPQGYLSIICEEMLSIWSHNSPPEGIQNVL